MFFDKVFNLWINAYLYKSVSHP